MYVCCCKVFDLEGESILPRIEEDDKEVFGRLMLRERSGSGFEEEEDGGGSMKIPSKGIFFLCIR